MIKNKPKEKRIFVYIFLLVFFLVISTVAAKRKRVLVIQSYHQEFSWTNEIGNRINEILPNSSIDLNFHFMDTKRHPSPDFKIKAGIEARKIISRWNPDVIITVDDNAQEYVGRHYIGKDRPYIVFAGVNAVAETYGYVDAQNVTGILERTPLHSIVEVMRHCFPEARRFIHISDASVTSQHIHEEYHQKDWWPFVCVKALMVDNFVAWKKEILEAQDKVDFLLYTHYHTLKRSPNSDEIVPPKEVIEWCTANSNVPELGNWGFFVTDGGMMSIAVSAREQAEVASEYARALLEGEDIGNLPIVETEKYSVYINKPRLNTLGIKLPMVYGLLAETAGNVVE